MSEQNSKRCRCCGETKTVEEFHLAKRGVLGRSPKCKPCTSAWHQANYLAMVAADPEFKAMRSGKTQARYAAMTKGEKRELMEKIKAHRKRLPNSALAKNLRRALIRKPTHDHVTQNELVEIYNKQDGKCALSGIKMTWAQEAWTETSMSIDRIDWRLGYVSGNVRLVCYAINCFRQRMTDNEMLAMAKAIVANMELKNEQTPDA